jgi:cellulose synthase/poly-beta-1,6-N-acetylglucosamine synthase-like glycosyltransferase
MREVIVVDNGSTDDTIERVRRFPVRLECIGRSFVSHSRNVGGSLATHDILAFVDSDCVVQPGWLEAALEVLDESVGVAGCHYELPADASWVATAWERARRSPQAERRKEVRYVPGGNFVLRRDVFRGVGGFDEAIETGEDMDLCGRIAAGGFQIVQSESIRCVHYGEPQTLKAVFRRNAWHGRGARIRYSSGRWCLVTAATGLFAAAIAVGLIGLVGAAITGQWWPSGAILFSAGVPGVYALTYAKPPRLLHATQLFAIYFAYFLGRTKALPVVAHRILNHNLIGVTPAPAKRAAIDA